MPGVNEAIDAGTSSAPKFPTRDAHAGSGPGRGYAERGALGQRGAKWTDYYSNLSLNSDHLQAEVTHLGYAPSLFYAGKLNQNKALSPGHVAGLA